MSQFRTGASFWRMLILFGVLAVMIGPFRVTAQDNPVPPSIEARIRAPHLSGSISKSVPAQMEPGAPAINLWGRIVYQSFQANNWDIYSNTEDGAHPVRLTDNSASDIDPRMNRSATRVAFASNRDGNYEIYSIQMDGTQLTRLTANDKDDGYPAWSPDGLKLAFQSNRDGQTELYVMNSDGSEQTRLTFDEGSDASPGWSPDGTKIVFVSNRTGYPRLWVMNSDGSAQTLLSDQNYSFDPVWSPNGEMIAYDADGNGDGWLDLWLMNADGSNQRMILASAEFVDFWAGSWSPDSKSIAFTNITYVYYQNVWYWLTAYIQSVHFSTGSINQFTGGDVLWNPDWRSLDNDAPESMLSQLGVESPGPIKLSWSGIDNGPSGIAQYEIQVSESPTNTWSTWTWENSSITSAQYPGVGGHTYSFRIRATDFAENVEPWSSDAQAVTRVESIPPVTTMEPLPEFVRVNNLAVYWSSTDSGGSGISRYDAEYRVGLNGDWQPLLMNSTSVAASIQSQPGNTFYFRARAVDNAQNVEPWPEETEATPHTTFYTWKITGSVLDAAGAPLQGAQIFFAPEPLAKTPTAPDGRYTRYGLQTTPVYTAEWQKAGYGLLPVTILSTSQDAQLDVVLPPLDNLVQTPGFETGDLSQGGWRTTPSQSAHVFNGTYHTGGRSALLGNYTLMGWEQPEKVADIQVGYSSAGKAQVAVDFHGVVHAVWEGGKINDSGTSVYYAWKTPEGPWSTPEKLSGLDLGGGPVIAIDTNNTVHVAWMSGSEVIYSNKPENGAWSNPEIFPFYMYDLQLVVDGQNRLHLAGWNSEGIQYLIRIQSQWSNPITVVAAQAANPSLVVDAGGTIHLAYTLFSEVYYVSKPENGAWTAPLHLSANAAGLVLLTVGADDRLYAVWNEFVSGLSILKFSSKIPGSNWSIPLDIDRGGHIFLYSFVHANGKICLSYYYLSQDWSQNRYIESLDGLAWTNPAAQPSSGFWVKMTTAPDGTLHEIWSNVQPGYSGDRTGEILYAHQPRASQTSEIALSQALTIPLTMTSPTLSFFYQLGGASTQIGAGLEVQLETITDTQTVYSTTTNAPFWQHEAVNLSAWAGAWVTVTFRTHQKAGGEVVWAAVDDVTLGSVYPDLFLQTDNQTARPGEVFTFTVQMGNQGGAAASGVKLTAMLPPGITFIRSEPAPEVLTDSLAWSLSDFPAKSPLSTVRITVQIAPDVSVGQNLRPIFSITTTSGEIEKSNNLLSGLIFIPPYTIFLPHIHW